MRAVVQRVSQARVEVQGQVAGSIGAGLLVLLGVGQADGPEQARWLAEKIASLRIFPDAEGKLNLSAREIDGEILVVSQFTLWGDCAKGRRPSYARAAGGDQAEPLYQAFCQHLRALGYTVASGVFGAMMEVHLVNSGPITLLLDSDKSF